MSDFLDLAIGHDLIDHGTSDDYYTPPYIFEALGVTFDMDVSAPPGGVPWIPARRSIDVIEDGLATPWEGLVWCNPPYSDPTPWIDKFIAHAHGLMLVQISKSQSVRRLWQSADGILVMQPDLKFQTGGGEKKGIYMPCIMASMGDISTLCLKSSGLGHVR